MRTIGMIVANGYLLLSMMACSTLESKYRSVDRDHKESVETDELGQVHVMGSAYSKNGVQSDPFVCTLSDAEQLARKDKLQKEVFTRIENIEEIETGYILSFKYDEGFLMKMADYVITENNCCPFFTFETTLHSRSDVLLKITGPKEAKMMLGMALSEIR